MMKTSTAAAAIAAIIALPASAQDPLAALDIGFGGEADLFLDRQVFGLDMTGEEHDAERVVPEGYTAAANSAFDGQTVFFDDGQTPLGTVETVYEDESGSRRLVITLADELEVEMIDAVYVSIPPENAPADAIRLNMTEEQLMGIAANWAD
jgi:hypothetical protein